MAQEPVPFTNTSSRLYKIAGQEFKPGDTLPVDPKHLDKLRKAPAVTSKDLVEGEAKMPPPKPVQKPSTLPDDLAKSLAYIKLEDNLEVLHAWAAAETNGGPKRPEVLTAISDRAKALAVK